ncbi:hypothetical protein Tco_0268125 [Tanacetum coccineum]
MNSFFSWMPKPIYPFLLKNFLKFLTTIAYSSSSLSDVVSKTSNDPLLARGNTLRSGEDSLKLNELMALCTNLQQMVLDLETTKTTQANEIASLKRRVKKLERRNKSRTHGLKRMYKFGLTARVESFGDEEDLSVDASKQGRRINAIDDDEDITLVNDQDDADMFGVNDLDGDEVIVDNVDVVKIAKETRSVVEEVTVVIEKAKLVSAAEETFNAAATTVSTASIIPASAATTTTTTTATITNVEITLAQALAELKSAKPKANKVVIQEPEHGTTTTTPTTIIFVPKPPQDKGKGIMIEEPVVEQVKPMKRLEQMRLDEKLAKIKADYQLAQRLQDQEQEELTGEEKIAGDELEQENAKKQKVYEDKETTELQSLIDVVLDDEEEVAIDVVPLATKPLTIVDWKIHKEGKKIYYQIIRADGKSQMYRVFSQMLKSFSMEDLEDLYKLVKAKYGLTRPVKDLDLILYGDLKTISFIEEAKCVHSYVGREEISPSPSTITDMLNKKLQADHFGEMAYQLLKLLTKQLKNQ